jgi:hypothetical protein
VRTDVNAGEKGGFVSNAVAVSKDDGNGVKQVNVLTRFDKEVVVRKEHVGPVLEKVTTPAVGKEVAPKVLVVETDGISVKGTGAEGSEQQQFRETVTTNQHHKKLVRMYRSLDNDLQWAKIGTVMNGEAIPVI